ncbi:PREDICTED: zinc finger protein 79-like, partial [Chaetura pelagica]|uniref:zinc finger protein 79-like n=1 Tax=Chaetura pelagica TaxID=8897 RepID=UPI0005237DED
GRPAPLQSQFRLTYPMILGLLRAQALRVQDVMRSSFAEFPLRRDAPRLAELQQKFGVPESPEEPLDCSLVPVVYEWARGMIHMGKKLYKCAERGKSFSTCDHLNCHQRVHTKERPFRCSKGEWSFVDTWALIRHLRVNAGEELAIGEECGKGSGSTRPISIIGPSMGIHMGKKLYKCAERGKSFSTCDHLNCHQRVHTKERPFRCSKGENSTLIKHHRTHRGEKPHTCPQCQGS